MKYKINKTNYSSFDILNIGTLAPRSYFIPFSSREKADGATLKNKRYTSDKVTLLGGEWDFKFYELPYLLEDILDTEKVRFDKLDVPSCWQFKGYAKPFYLNARYQFPFDPPNIPTEDKVGKVYSWQETQNGFEFSFVEPENEYNYVGVYRKKFALKTDKTHILSFLGVASCADVYLNGEHLGYFEGSHNTSEFDITPLQRVGENELLVVVRRWCTGTYLECQDMFRNNGIFRDVLLFEEESFDVRDIEFTCKKEGYYSAEVKVYVTGEGIVNITLCAGTTQEKKVKSVDGVATASFSDLKVEEWNAERPVLYNLYIETEKTCVKLRVGFKDIKISGNVFLLGGRKLKLHGVNHHDTHPKNGYTLTADEIEKDIILCKDYNIDTVRTSHYPPDPLFLELCDEYGIYVVDEADLETHGAQTQQNPSAFGSITSDEKWENRYIDRAAKLYSRDKNHTCVIMWSLGNESGGYRNTDKMYAYLKKRTPIPVHYESAVHSKRICYDIASEMYPPVKDVAAVGANTRRPKKLCTKPYFMCEYAHAMGVGPGAIEEYWQQIYAHDNLLGGCVWEMFDHAVLGKDGYTYGGDHGEFFNDSNFCVDGIFYPDRTPSTGAKIVAFTYRPVRVKYLGGENYEFFNTQAFSSTENMKFVFVFGGEKKSVAVNLAPLEKKSVKLSSLNPAGDMTVETYRGEKLLSKEQVTFNPVYPVLKKAPLPEYFSVKDGKVVIDVFGKSMKCGVPHTVLFRARTDNDHDREIRKTLDTLARAEEKTVNITYGEKVLIESEIISENGNFKCEDLYEGCNKGVLVTSTIYCKGYLPRFGKSFELDKSFDNVTYRGRNGETYVDMKEQAQIETVRLKVSDMTERNIRPQESGNRCDCTFVSLSDGERIITFTAVDTPFSLGVKPYSDKELISMRHRCDEVVSGTFVTISLFQMGIGTGSCGPSTLLKYRFKCNGKYVLKYLLEISKNPR